LTHLLLNGAGEVVVEVSLRVPGHLFVQLHLRSGRSGLLVACGIKQRSDGRCEVVGKLGHDELEHLDLDSREDGR